MLEKPGEPTITEAHPRPVQSIRVPASCFMGTSFRIKHTICIGNVEGQWHSIPGVVSVDV